jgi:hypothetical protein
MTQPTATARNDSFVWLVALARDIALIAFCVVFIIDTL